MTIEILLEQCALLVNDPQNYEDNFNKMVRGLQIKKYLPLDQKLVILYSVLLENNLSLDTLPAVFSSKIEVSLLFNGLLAYTNIEGDISVEIKTYENYDLIYMSGLADYILQFCSNDYNKLIELLNRSIAFENLVNLINSLSAIDAEETKDLVEEFKKFRENTDPQILENISDIVRYNDPMLYNIKNEVVDKILEKLNRADEKEQHLKKFKS